MIINQSLHDSTYLLEEYFDLVSNACSDCTLKYQSCPKPSSYIFWNSLLFLINSSGIK